MPLINEGYKIKTEDDILLELLDSLKVSFPSMAMTESNLAVVLMKILARQLSDVEYSASKFYNDVYIATASGVALNKIVLLQGITRSYGNKSNGKVTITKKPDYENVVLQSHTKLKANNLVFITQNETPITLTDTPLEVEVVSEFIGTIYNVLPNSITAMVNPVAGIASITNAEETIGGKDTETDYELKKRYFEKVRSSKNSSLTGIIEQIKSETGANTTTGRENNTSEVLDTLPPHSFEIFVDSGTDQEIAEVIFRTKPAGIATHGNVTVNVEFNNNTYPIKFSRFEQNDVFVRVSLKIEPTLFPPNSQQLITESIINYCNGNNLINYSELLSTIINSAKGIVDYEFLYVGDEEGTEGTEDLSSGVGSYWTCSSENIELIV